MKTKTNPVANEELKPLWTKKKTKHRWKNQTLSGKKKLFCKKTTPFEKKQPLWKNVITKTKTPLTLKQIKPLLKKQTKLLFCWKKPLGKHIEKQKYGKKTTLWRKPLFRKKNFWKKTLIFNRNPHFEENPPI